MKLEFSRQILELSSNIKFYQNPFTESRVVPYGRTDGWAWWSEQSQFCDCILFVCLSVHFNHISFIGISLEVVRFFHVYLTLLCSRLQCAVCWTRMHFAEMLGLRLLVDIGTSLELGNWEKPRRVEERESVWGQTNHPFLNYVKPVSRCAVQYFVCPRSRLHRHVTFLVCSKGMDFRCRVWRLSFRRPCREFAEVPVAARILQTPDAF